MRLLSVALAVVCCVGLLGKREACILLQYSVYSLVILMFALSLHATEVCAGAVIVSIQMWSQQKPATLTCVSTLHFLRACTSTTELGPRLITMRVLIHLTSLMGITSSVSRQGSFMLRINASLLSGFPSTWNQLLTWHASMRKNGSQSPMEIRNAITHWVIVRAVTSILSS